jgi:bifunctional enzyme CysN/CysC
MSTDMLRFTTAGSVDDGKSTLIGRLLYDSKAIFQDQYDALERASRLRGDDEVDLSLLTDGLRAEREQKITIDVAYRYFSTPRRKFIIADTPGHEHYTRNMVTGASTADLAVVLIDARKGVLPQSRRHGIIASLLGIPHVVVAVNKMDLVGYDQGIYDAIASDYELFSEKLAVRDLTFIPISALKGDNVVHKSEATPWYEGPALLHHLEHVTIAPNRNLVDFRFPVQYVIRPHQDFRGYAGLIASGTIRPGEEVAVLPSGRRTRVARVLVGGKDIDEAFEGQSVVITLAQELDVSRGDMIVRVHNVPFVERRFDAILCWMDEERALRHGVPYLLQHTTRRVRAQVTSISYRIDVNTLHRQEAAELGLNEIGRVSLETAEPIFFDHYTINKATGGFILVDAADNRTVAAGMIRYAAGALPEAAPPPQASANVTWSASAVTEAERTERAGHLPAVVWLTGLSGSGKSTIAQILERRLFDAGAQVTRLDGDNVRHGLCRDLGFSDTDRTENIRRVGEVARLFHDAGCLVLCTFISPFRADRDRARSLLPPGRFVEVYVRCDLEECRRRDPKGLYRRAEAGEIPEFTGVSSPYEEPATPELVVDSGSLSAADGAEAVLARLRELGIVPPQGKA